MRITPFKSHIWRFNLGVIQELTISKCYTLEQQVPTACLSNRGGYQSPDISLEQMFPELYQNICLLKSIIEDEAGFKLNVVNAWVNINRKHDYNIAHIHNGAAFSGVVYLKTPPNSGAIVFENPAAVDLYPVNIHSPLFYNSYYIPPTVGDVMFFPAYLSHFVEANKSDEDRISIAFNLVMA